MVAPRLLIVLLNVIWLALLRSVVAQNPGGAAGAGLFPCSGDAICSLGLGLGVKCAPDGYCGDAGAACTADLYCYDYCGSNGICGGVGAYCNTNDHDDYQDYKCNIGNNCVNGVCQAAGASQRKRRSDLQPKSTMPDQSLCAGLMETACMENGRSVCTDLKSDFMNCGACGNDCGDVHGVADVGCVRGTCAVEGCRAGWTLQGSACIGTGAKAQLQNNRIGGRSTNLLL
ncbi:hypothetical protein CALVIDRAFT_251245 [Calocera viscosa TUFC12733]|uniref:Protein CPL1-like domain-containing protein n=1 Tax=Calocera viscosa (strain TUFC12733) TaxID=1330018 RepID=A0A167JFL3_CALVF|nr:hypothetical protein CALVIDRAFT_251245 [Calocera viscosa TUFC12733]